MSLIFVLLSPPSLSFSISPSSVRWWQGSAGKGSDKTTCIEVQQLHPQHSHCSNCSAPGCVNMCKIVGRTGRMAVDATQWDDALSGHDKVHTATVCVHHQSLCTVCGVGQDIVYLIYTGELCQSKWIIFSNTNLIYYHIAFIL